MTASISQPAAAWFALLLLAPLASLQAGVVYSNLDPLNDSGASLIFTGSQTEVGDQIQFSQATSLLEFASIGTYNESASTIVSNATLRIYNVNVSNPLLPLLGNVLGSFTLLNHSFTSGAVELLNFTLNGLPVGLNAIWTLSFSNPTGLGINNFRNSAPTIGFSSPQSYWTNEDSGSPQYRLIGAAADLNFQAEFTAVPEPGTIALSALALGALLLRRRALKILPVVLLAISPSFAATKDVVPANDWAQIRAEYERHRHQITNNQAHSPYQGWNTTFSPTGFLVTPKDGNWTWGLNLKSYGLADQIQRISAPTQSTTNKNELRHQHGNLTHWFINAPSGLEEGWTIHSRPEGTAKELRVTLEVKGSLAARADGSGARFLNSTQQTILNYKGLKAWDATGKPLSATMTTQGNEVQIAVNQQDAQYPITIDPIAQQAVLTATNAGSNDQFGFSAAISGDTIVIGAPGEDSNSTGVGSAPTESAEDSGAAYVFVRSNGSWTQQAYLKASNTEAYDGFGSTVAISGGTIIVGAVGEDSNGISQADNSALFSGAVYIFHRSGSNWSQQAYLKAPRPVQSYNFGNSVGISGDSIVVGSVRDAGTGGSQSGAAYVFTRTSSTWTLQATLKASNAAISDFFGDSVAISGETIVVGAHGEDSNGTGGPSDNTVSSSGAAYVFVRANGAWSQQAYLKASNPGATDVFGRAVAIWGDTIVVGARGEDSNGSSQTDNSAGESGAAYVFSRTGTTWTQQAYLKASNPGIGHSFGFSVAISRDTIVVGAPSEMSEGIGVNGTQTNNPNGPGALSGAAYVFTRSAGVWTQQAYLKANATILDFNFGHSVGVASDALSGTSIVVGAIHPDFNVSPSAINASTLTPTNFATSKTGAAIVFFDAPPAPVNITINSSPANLLFSTVGDGCAPGTNLASPQTLIWTPGSNCQISFTTPQTTTGTQRVFSQWEDGSTNAVRAITAPSSAATYTATFQTNHQLTVTSNPPGISTLTPVPSFFAANSVQRVTATRIPPLAGCHFFSSFTGAPVTNLTNANAGANATVSADVTMSGPINLVANYTIATPIATVNRGPVLTVRGVPGRYRQTLSVTNPLAVTANVSIAVRDLGTGVSLVNTPSGNTTTCFPPAAAPFFTIFNVPAGQAAAIALDFNAPSAQSLSYRADAVAGRGLR
jgi:trimeric autotransporter adhesin